ncbi:CYTH domain-containing protein [Anaerobacillus arseniciselenatis]|uniref:CYTH domain-containing protein n=1 Tax=Anaerobacillus arseniciselenatis TaxID=85682 RepID=A0A1S2LCY6_9BACI|nr:CYTH domain-containing protein [Anaerobacillus arseniciselenatis]OIJ10120.1 CYTH domain-containing protein [Anaerobacillus arseniciselenatis]
MTQEIEIEFKNIVTKNDFEKLLAAFTIEASQFKKQVNHYFDTTDFQLKNHQCALRIREKNQKYTMTLKQPNQVGLLETHQLLTKNEADIALTGGKLPEGALADHLFKCFKIDIKECLFLGSLITKRVEIPYHGGTLVFDHSFYLDEEDFEIEYEVTDEPKGKKIFDELFSKYHIPIVKTENKIKRFFSKKLQTNKHGGIE